MPGWLSGLIGLFTGPLRDIWNKIVALVTTVYKWVSKGLTILGNDFTTVLGDLVHLSESVANFIYHTYNTFVSWVDKTFSDVIKWASGELASIEKYAGDILAWATRQFDAISKWISGLIGDVEKWVISDIYDPLYKFASGAVSWIEHEGAFVYDLLTHPDKLVQVLMAYIWGAWLTLFRQFTRPLVAYIVQHFRSVVPDLVSVMEDIITSIL